MRFRLLLTATVMLIGASMASASAETPARAHVIRTLQVGTGLTLVDADHSGGQSVGDYFVLTAKHLNPVTHRVTGTGTAICTQIDQAGTIFDCQGEDQFGRGELREAGQLKLTSRGFRFAILGGTGPYLGAWGEVRGTFLNAAKTKARVTFTYRTR